MNGEIDAFVDEVVASLTDGTFASATLWGALVGGLVAILEYNLAAFHGNGIELGYFFVVAGIVAAVLYNGDRRGASRAGMAAAGIPVLVLAPLEHVIWISGSSLGWDLGQLLLTWGFLAIVAFPLVVGFCAAMGGLTAHLTHWILDELVGWKTDEKPRTA